MKKPRKLTSLFLAAVTAVTSVFCGAVTASAATSAYDLIKDLQKHPVTADSVLDSTISYNYEWKSNDLIITVAGLETGSASELADLKELGCDLSISFGVDTGFNAVFENKQHMVHFKRERLDGEYQSPEMSLVYFTKSGSSYKLSFKIELSKLYTIVAPIKTMMDNAAAASFSLSAVDTDTGSRTYYGRKKFYYIPFSKAKTETINISDLTFAISKTKVYNGSKLYPDISIKNGSYSLRKDTDYTVTYKNNVKVGIGTVIIKGKGSYTGSVKANFRIIPPRPGFKDAVVNGSKIQLSWGSVAGIDIYEIYRSSDGGKTFERIAVLNSGTLQYYADFPQLAYYMFKIRACKIVNGKAYYSKFSDVTRTFKNR